MSEAMVRECYKCKKRFIKEEGCNKMVCSCGAMMCYLCKMPIKGYDHFAHGRCPLWTNSLQLHAEEVQQRAAEAKQKLDPNVDLVHDPTTDLPQVRHRLSFTSTPRFSLSPHSINRPQ
ncbi:UNVERIFIED_CONTAM: hypothetical protein GTU68_053140 [Idotea baltica]|nr:hypothetical protein [Idotea baltica]